MIAGRRRIAIPCSKGVASFLALELQRLGFPIVGQTEAAIETEGTWDDALKLNLWIRTGQAILLELHRFRAATPDQLYHGVADMPWEEWIHPDGYVTVTSSVLTQAVRDPRFATLRVKDAIVDRMVRTTGARPNSGPDRTGVVVHAHWEGPHATVYLNTSGDTLAKRGYRRRTVAAPMQEALAAACITASGWDGATAFANPMCGSGTLAIEAALIAANRAPGLTRRHFGFMKVRGYKETTWKALCREAEAAADQRLARPRIVASDIDPAAVQAARENADTAGVSDLVAFSVCDFRESEVPPAPGVVMLNPEYGQRLGRDKDLKAEYKAIGDFFKQKCSGYMGYVFTGSAEAARNIGLRTKRRLVLYNSNIECRLLEFELYAGTRNP
jgi:23S rRNA G2445 N2-methylase RlmL